MIDRPADLDPLGLRLVQHIIEYLGRDAKGDMQIERAVPRLPAAGQAGKALAVLGLR